MARIASITIYPIKSLDGTNVEAAGITPNGSIEWDRRLAICDAQGKFVNGKRTAAIHSIRAMYGWDPPTATLASDRAAPEVFSLIADHTRLAQWLSAHFGFPVGLVENIEGGFPDDTDAHGPTVVSTATIETVAGWFPDVSWDEVHRRFRANLCIDGVPPFWEDSLYTASGGVAWRFGDVVLMGRNSSQRCVVPSRGAHTGEVMPGFARTFAERRQQSLPSWAPREKFDHFYRLATNTSAIPDSAGKTFRVGDPVAPLTIP